MNTRLYRGVTAYVAQLRRFNRNIRLIFVATVLGNVGQGILRVALNLYILSLGVGPEMLGAILSAGPIAYALASIPTGLMDERMGHKRTLLWIYGLAGVAQLAQVATGKVPMIFAASFVAGWAMSGDFVVRLPFISENTSDADRDHAFSSSHILSNLAASLGALVAGFGPNLLRAAVPDLTTAYRYTLYLGGALTLAAVLPLSLIHGHGPRPRVKLSLRPYLWGMDRFTRRLAIIEGCLGVSMGLVMPFQNLYFIYHLGSSREFFGTVSALSIVPGTIATALGPAAAAAAGAVQAFGAMRLLMPLPLVLMAWTTQPWLGSLAFWFQRVLFVASQPIAFAFAMKQSSPQAKAAASAWLNITFWVGQAAMAPLAGWWIARSNFAATFYLSSVAALLAGVCTFVWFGAIQNQVSTKASSVHGQEG
jgi:MFS family permease